MRSDWTPERIELMRRLRKVNGLSAEQIAKALNLTGARFSRNAVIGKLMRSGIDKPEQRALRHERAAASIKHGNKVHKQTAKPKVMKPEPISERGAVRGPNAIAFIERRPRQCPMFCAGEEGPMGLVCGEVVASGSWCAACAKLIFQPVRKRAA